MITTSFRASGETEHMIKTLFPYTGGSWPPAVDVLTSPYSSYFTNSRDSTMCIGFYRH